FSTETTVCIPLRATLFPATCPSSSLVRSPERRSPAHIPFPLTIGSDYRRSPDRAPWLDRTPQRPPTCLLSIHRDRSIASAEQEARTSCGSHPPASASFLPAHTSAEFAGMCRTHADADVPAPKFPPAKCLRNRCQWTPRAAAAPM